MGHVAWPSAGAGTGHTYKHGPAAARVHRSHALQAPIGGVIWIGM